MITRHSLSHRDLGQRSRLAGKPEVGKLCGPIPSHVGLVVVVGEGDETYLKQAQRRAAEDRSGRKSVRP